MAAYNLFDPGAVFQNILGTAHLATGSLTFYSIGTTTPKDTWNDPDLAPAHLNTNPLNLDSSGRVTADLFGDGEYTVKLTDGPDGTGSTIWTHDRVPGGDAGLSIPALVAGYFLSNDGASILWDAVRQVPDPTGQSGKALTSTGSSTTWTAFPTAPTLDVVITANSIRIGDGVSSTKFMIQWANNTAPASGTKSTSKAITWATPFASLAHVAVTTTISSATPSGALVDNAVPYTQNSPSTGVTVSFNVSDDDSSASWQITNPITFTYIGFGTVTV